MRTIVVAIATALALAGCSSGGGGSAELSDEPVTLRFTWWGGDERHELTQKVIDLFEKEHPNITVKGEFKDWNGYWDSLATTVAANDAPDIIQMDELYLASYGERGALLDLGTVEKHLDTADFDPKVLATGQLDGKQFALPVGVSSYSMIANTDLLKKYDVELPDDATWSWDDLKKVGAEVSKASGGKVKGVDLQWGFYAGSLHIWARQQGHSVFDDEGNVSVPPEVLADFWQYQLDLAEEKISPSPSVTVEQANGGLEQSGTATNTSVFAPWWNTQITAVTASSGSKLKLMRLPGEAEADSPGAYYKPSMYWSISARSEHPAEAALLVDFLANSEQAAKVLSTERGVPANTKIRETITGSLGETDKAAVDYMEAIEVGEPPRVTPNGASDVESILRRHTENVLFGRTTPQEAAAAFIKELQAEIDAA